MSEFSEPEKYNFIFNQIVENEDDFVGSMAYVLYKWTKINYIEKYKKENDNKEPSLEELREWQKSECAAKKISHYKELAEKKANVFVNNLQGEKEKQLADRKANLDKAENAIQTREKQVKAREDAVNKKEQDVRNKEVKVKTTETQLNKQECDIKNRDRYCHVKTINGHANFWLGVA